MLRKIVRGPGAGCRQGGEALEGGRELEQQREVRFASPDAFEHPRQALQRLVRVVEAGGHLDNARRQSIHPGLRRGSHAAIDLAFAQLSQACKHRRGIRVSPLGQHLDALFLGRVAEPQAAQGIRCVGRTLVREYGLELAGDRIPMLFEASHERSIVVAVHGACHHSLVLTAGGQALCLFVLQVLQPVLQIAQEHVGRAQIGYGLER